MNNSKKAVGYIRVSTLEQASNTSLEDQREKIRMQCKLDGRELVKIYEDPAISGRIDDRPELMQMMRDAELGKFQVVVFTALDRFGRSATQIQQNIKKLRSLNIEVVSIKEKLDTDTPIGNFQLNILAAIAELEVATITERMLNGRIANARSGKLPSGTPPYGRYYDKLLKSFKVDEQKKEIIQWAAQQYLNGVGFRELPALIKDKYNETLSKDTLQRVILHQSGPTWINTIKGVEYEIKMEDELLDPETIKKVKELAAFQQTNKRAGNHKYPLTGFLKCSVCGCRISGDSGYKSRNGQRASKKYHYYNHPNNECTQRFNIDTERMERAVFLTIFEVLWDVPNFNKAIENALPTEDDRMEIDSKIKATEASIKDNEKLWSGYNQKVSKGIVKGDDIIRQTMEDFQQERIRLDTKLAELKDRKKYMRPIEEVVAEQNEIRNQFLEKFSSPEHYENMTHQDKQNLLHWLFDGKDSEGRPYSIYLEKINNGKKYMMVDYFMYGRITGLRTMRGDDINYTEHVEVETIRPKKRRTKKPRNINERYKAPTGPLYWIRYYDEDGNLVEGERYKRKVKYSNDPNFYGQVFTGNNLSFEKRTSL